MNQEMRDLRQALEGVHNYLPTPFDASYASYAIDAEGLQRNVAFYAGQNPVNMTITVAGGYGEGLTLDLEEHEDIVAAAVGGAQRQMPVMAGVIGGYRNSLRMAHNAEIAGADAIIIFLPVSSPTEESAFEYFHLLATSVEVGVVVFPRERADFWPRVLQRLAEIPNVIGFVPPGQMVDLGKDLDSLVPDRLLWIAENEPNAARAFPFGSRAYTTAAAAIVPDACREFWELGIRGEAEKMNEVLRSRIQPVLDIRRYKPGYGISGIKLAMESLGLSGGPVRPPGVQVAAEDGAAIIEVLRRHPEVRDLVKSI